jgi:hypothetical protein
MCVRHQSLPDSLACLTDLSGVKGKTVVIQVFDGRKLVKRGGYPQLDSTINAWTAIYPTDVGSTGSLLLAARYRCRFLPDSRPGSVVRAGLAASPAVDGLWTGCEKGT